MRTTRRTSAVRPTGRGATDVSWRHGIVSDSDLADAARKLDLATKQPQSGGSGLPQAAGDSR